MVKNNTTIIVFLSLIFSLLAVVGCKDENDFNSGGGSIEPGDSARRTVLAYIMAENSLGRQFPDWDLKEMLQGVKNMPSDCYFIAFVDDTKLPRICRFYNNKKGIAVCDTVYKFKKDFCSTDTANVRMVFDWVMEKYPSESLGVIMWSHGDGWLRSSSLKSSIQQRTIGVDNGRNDYSNSPASFMQIEELAHLLETLSIKPEFLFFDACFMQCVEVAYALRNATHWMLGSSAEMPGYGAPYHTLMPYFFTFPFNPESFIQDIYSYYTNGSGVLLSAIKCSEVDRVMEATSPYIAQYFSVLHSPQYDNSRVQSYLLSGYFSSSYNYPEYFDMNALMKSRLSQAEYAAWYQLFKKMVPYSVATSRWYTGILDNYLSVDATQYGGVSMYLPNVDSKYSFLNKQFSTIEWYMNAGWKNAGWDYISK